MNRRVKFKLFRGTSTANGFSEFVPEEGEPFYIIDKKELVVGDGISPVTDLRHIGCVAKAPNGQLYAVEVDNDGNAKTTPIAIRSGLGMFSLCADDYNKED